MKSDVTKRQSFVLGIALLVTGVPSSPAAEQEAVKKRPPSGVRSTATPVSPKNLTTRQERMDRAVDEMAASSRDTAILNLKRMLKLKRGTSQEATIIWRLADMEWRSSKSYFRVGISKGDSLAPNSRFNELLEACVAHCTELLTRFPKFKSTRDVLIRRGRAFEELKRKDYALRDYLDYIGRYPNEKNTVEVRLMASDVLAEQSKHAEILKILQPVNVDRSLGGLEGQVVEKQALANFNIENYPEAIRKAEWLLRYDRNRGMSKETGGHYDEVAGMLALFYGTAFEKRLAGYSLEHALDYFRRLEGGRAFGKLSHEFMVVMRSKEMQAEMLGWKELVLKKMPRATDTLWVLVDAYDAIISWKDFGRFGGIEQDFDFYFAQNPGAIAKVQTLEWYKKFKRTLLEYADKIYATLPKKDPNENDFKVIQGPYLMTLNAFMRITDPRDETKARVRFRIGEFYTGVKDWEKAQAAFADVYQAKLFIVPSQELRDQARLRAMTARYDYFKEKGIIPQSLKAGKLSSAKKPLPVDVIEWIRWVDEVAALKSTQPETMDKLLFEANRVVYSFGDIALAYKRMLFYIGSRPTSKLTPAVCALVVDTLIESEAWVATRALAIKFQEMPNVAVGEFKTKLVQLERDSHYKITTGVFKTKNFAKARSLGEEHLKIYPDSKHKIEILSMLGKASLELKDTEGSLAYMNQVIEIAPHHESVGVAYFVRGTDAEKKFLFKQAFDDFLRVFKLPADRRGISENDLPALKKKLFFLGLVADDKKTSETLLKSPEFCGTEKVGDLRGECERLSAIASIENENERRSAWALADLGSKAPKDVKAAWYAAALARGHQIPNSVVITTVEEFLKSFDKLDAMSQMEVLSSLQTTIPRLYARKMEVVESNSPISRRLDDLQQTLQKRVREVQGMEKLAASLLSLPSSEVKVRVLGMLAKAYEHIADQLRAMPTPKGFKEEEAAAFKQAMVSMIDPLTQKVAQIGAQTWDVAKQAGIQTPWTDAVTDQHYGEAYAKYEITWKPEAAYLEALSDNGRKSQWADMVRNRKVRPMIFFHQISQSPQAEKLGLDESDKALLQLATLRSMGLEAEATQLLKEKEATLKGQALRLGMLTRVYQNVISKNFDGVRSSRKSFLEKRLSDDNREEARILSLAEKVDETSTTLIAEAEAEAAKKRTPATNVVDEVPEAKKKSKKKER